jgi:DNA-binding response OmpR family regulator
MNGVVEVPKVLIHTPKIFVVCDQIDTAPVWGYILRQQGLVVILEASLEKALERWASEMPDLVVIDVDAGHRDPVAVYKKFRALSVAPILLFLPAHHEKLILDAYAAGVDDVIVKPITPAIFSAKVQAWGRRSWMVSVDGLRNVRAGRHRLEPSKRSLVDPNGKEIRLTNLEFQLLHLLMSRPAHLFNTEELIQTIWGEFGSGDHILLRNVVYRLRKKIESDPSRPVLLQTRPGGYSFQE